MSNNDEKIATAISNKIKLEIEKFVKDHPEVYKSIIDANEDYNNNPAFKLYIDSKISILDKKSNSFWQKLSDRFSDANISKGWKITRNVAAGIMIVGGILTGPACPIVLSATALWWIGAVTTVSSFIAVGAQATVVKK